MLPGTRMTASFDQFRLPEPEQNAGASSPEALEEFRLPQFTRTQFQQEGVVIPSLRVNEQANAQDRTVYRPDMNLVDIYNNSKDAVVRIAVDKGQKTDSGRSLETTGSGFFVTADGKIATDLHVVRGAQGITITTADGRTYNAKIEDVEPKADLALLSVQKNSPSENFAVLPLGSSSDLIPGEGVVALGHPKGWQPQFIAPGTVRTTRLLRDILPQISGGALPGEDINRLIIESRIHVEGGNSGGPMLNGDGKVVGIVGLSDSNSIAQATPVEDLQNFLARNRINSQRSVQSAYTVPLFSQFEKPGSTTTGDSSPSGGTNLWNFKIKESGSEKPSGSSLSRETPTPTNDGKPTSWELPIKYDNIKREINDVPRFTHTALNGFNTFRSFYGLSHGTPGKFGGLFSVGLGTADLLTNDAEAFKAAYNAGDTSKMLSSGVQVAGDALLIGGGLASMSKRFVVPGLLATAGGSIIKLIGDGVGYTKHFQ
jgi:S1-C subfamily serine protease